jgi:hypothetical protein
MAVILTATTMGASVGPFDIYHTSEVGGNLLASGVSRSELVSGYSVTPYNTYIIRSTGTCTNAVTVTGCVTITPTPTATSAVPTPTPTVTGTPTATPVGPTATPTATPTPTSARTAITVRYRTTGAPNPDACLLSSPTNTYYFDGTQLQTATYVWTDPYINNPVPGGYTLSDGTTYRIVNAGGSLGTNVPCTGTTPTPTATVPTQRMQIRECGQFNTYYIEFQYSSNFFNGAALKLQSSGAFLDGKCWEIIDNNYTGGIVDYQATFVSFHTSCGSCPP